jgi:hypothetical protein
MITRKFHSLSLVVVLWLFVGLALAQAGDQPKYTVAEVMKALHQGDDSAGKRVLAGKVTQEDFVKLVEYYAMLPLNEPEQGDPVVWKQKSTTLLEAAKALQEGKDGALDRYKRAVDCKSCHSVYRPQ